MFSLHAGVSALLCQTFPILTTLSLQLKERTQIS